MNQAEMLIYCDKLLKEVGENLGLPVYINQAPIVESCIVYIYQPTTNNGATHEDYLEVRVILENEDLVIEASKELEDRFIGLGDTCKLDGATYCIQTTGGSTTDYINGLTHFFFGYTIIY